MRFDGKEACLNLRRESGMVGTGQEKASGAVRSVGKPQRGFLIWEPSRVEPREQTLVPAAIYAVWMGDFLLSSKHKNDY